MRKRRRTKYTWLPNLGTPIGENPTYSGLQLAVDIAADGGSTVGVIPLTFDYPIDNTVLSPPEVFGLGSVLLNEYFLRRIVGKVHVNHEVFFNNQDGVPTVNLRATIVCAAFFIARAGATDQAEQNAPIGYATSGPEDYNPLAATCIREPWIWRRCWILGYDGLLARINDDVFNTITHDLGDVPPGVIYQYHNFPSTNVAYGSVLDGPHLDAKTARRIKQDERLFFAVSAQNYPINTAQDIDTPKAVRVSLDYRLLGAMRKPRNQGAF